MQHLYRHDSRALRFCFSEDLLQKIMNQKKIQKRKNPKDLESCLYRRLLLKTGKLEL